MDRQNRRHSNYQEHEELSRWDFNDNSDTKQCSNIFKYLCNNINLYDNAYKKEAHTLKRISHGSMKKRNTSVVPEEQLISITENVSKSYSKHRLKRQIQNGRRRMITDASQIDNVHNFENLNVNLLMNLRQLRGKYSQTVNTNLSVKNMEFNKQSKEYIKKKDRYREIFGEKPRYIFVKADDNEGLKKVKIGGSVTLFKPR